MSSKSREVLDDYFLNLHPMCHIFSETLDKIQFNENDFSHPDSHQECQDVQECPPSPGRFLMTIFQLTSYVSYIFGHLRQNPVQ